MNNFIGWVFVTFFVLGLVGAVTTSELHASNAADNSLVVACGPDEPQNLDPLLNFSAKSQLILQQLYEGLVTIDVKGQIQPCLAVEWKRLGAKKTCFELRRGVRFHDGSVMTAQHVATSINRYLDPDSPFPGRRYFASLLRARVVAPDKVVVTTSSSDGLLLHKMALMFIYSFTQGSATAPWRTPGGLVGTGPFRYKRWELGRILELEAAPSYWQRGRPKLSRLVFQFSEKRSFKEVLLAGEVDLILDGGYQLSRIIEAGDFTVHRVPTLTVYVGSLNTQHGPFKYRAARKALSLSIDRQDAVDYIERSFGRALATPSAVGAFGHNEELSIPRADRHKARALLESVVKPPVSIRVLAKKVERRLASFIRASASRVGFDVEVEYTDDAGFLRRAAAAELPFDLLLGSCPDPYCHSAFVQSIILHSSSPYTRSCVPEFDQRFEAACSQLDPDRQRQAFIDLEAYVYERCLALSIMQKHEVVVARRGLVFEHYISGIPRFLDAHW